MNIKKVLVADDDFLDRRYILRALKEFGAEVVGEATDGAQAITMTCELKPDIVLMDIEMPELDGLDAAEIIQETCPTPVIILTAHESTDLLERAVSSGVSAYLVKPPKAPDIRRAIDIVHARHNDLMMLRALVKEKDMLVREMCHRVKNNFSVVISLISLQARSSQSIELKKALSEIESRIRTMSLIHEMLYQSFDIKNISISRYVAEASRAIFRGYALENSRIKLVLDVEEDLCSDMDTIVPCGLILNELITNAFKYAFKGKAMGTLTVALKKASNNCFMLQVSDDGPGLPDGFDIQSRASLGTTIITSLAKQINGSLEIKKGPGAAFTLHFPRSIQKDYECESELDHKESCSDRLILLVDDDRLNQLLLRKVIKSSGYCCDIASNGKEAMRLLSSRKYSLVLMDIELPDIKGSEVMDRMRGQDAQGPNRNTPAVAVTGHGERAIIEKLHRHGFSEILQKPLDLSRITSMIRQYSSG